jgi:hypothetical protein
MIHEIARQRVVERVVERAMERAGGTFSRAEVQSWYEPGGEMAGQVTDAEIQAEVEKILAERERVSAFEHSRRVMARMDAGMSADEALTATDEECVEDDALTQREMGWGKKVDDLGERVRSLEKKVQVLEGVSVQQVLKAMRPVLRLVYRYFAARAERGKPVRGGRARIAKAIEKSVWAVRDAIPVLIEIGFLKRAGKARVKQEMKYHVKLNFDRDRALAIIKADRDAARRRLENRLPKDGEAARAQAAARAKRYRDRQQETA